jgi:hypothetical protein
MAILLPQPSDLIKDCFRLESQNSRRAGEKSELSAFSVFSNAKVPYLGGSMLRTPYRAQKN